MDKRSILGFILIFIIIILMQPYFKLINKNAQQEPQQAIKHEAKEETAKLITEKQPVLTKRAPIDTGAIRIYTIETDLYKATISS
ncbi:MAG: hypothetical protein KAW56_01735, partial [Candidatus Marinimicrobia bacterium]|nr:hypothetical protein [Candidatus Neomarinimicrobiota bacterium]